jgi:tektin-5
VEKLLADIRSCLEFSEKCLFERERRIGIDLCRDEVERSLTKEVNAMRCAIDKLEKLVDKTTIQLKLVSLLTARRVHQVKQTLFSSL